MKDSIGKSCTAEPAPAGLPPGLVENREEYAAQVALLALVLTVLVRTAWMSDDAEITLRCVMNFIHGYGPNFNIDERVQAFTHPLWFLLITGGTLLTRNVFAATFALSFIMSLATWWIVMSRVATSFWAGMLAGGGLLLSKAFVDYSTSGLENPLSHLLLVVGLLLGFGCLDSARDRRSVTVCIGVLMLTYLSRPDLVLLVAPFAALVLAKCCRRWAEAAYIVVIAATPEVLWVLFSLFYYGAPLPNTAYAKLGTGFPHGELIQQGLIYLFESWSRDPITLTFIVLGILLAMRHGPGPKAIAAGIVLYLAYLVSIGGDFMTGRFLTEPLVLGSVILARTPLSRVDGVMVGLVLAGFGVYSLPSTILSGTSYKDMAFYQTGITDERGFMFPGRGLTTAIRGFFAEPVWGPVPGITSIEVGCGLMGSAGIVSGPGLHFIDECGLADPLLARLPAKHYQGWRIGHFERQLPSGYAQSILTGANLLTDSSTRDYWEIIKRATRGRLFSLDRLAAVARLNLGMVTKPDSEPYGIGHPAPRVVNLSLLSQTMQTGGAWYDPRNTLFESAIDIRLPSLTAISSINVSLDFNDTYLIEYSDRGRFERLGVFGPTQQGGMIGYQLKLPNPTPPTDLIRISAIGGDHQYSVGYLVLNR